MPAIRNARRSAYAEKDIIFAAMVLARLEKLENPAYRGRMPSHKLAGLTTVADVLKTGQTNVTGVPEGQGELLMDTFMLACVRLQDALKHAFPGFYIPMDCCFELLSVPALQKLGWKYTDQTKGSRAATDSEASSFEDDEDSDGSMEDDYDSTDDTDDDDEEYVETSEEEAQTTSDESDGERPRKRTRAPSAKDATDTPPVGDADSEKPPECPE